MQKLSLDALAREVLTRAADAAGGRAAQTVVGGHERVLRQTVIAMVKDATLAEHANTGEASLHVLRGRILLSAAVLHGHAARPGGLDGRWAPLAVRTHVPATVESYDDLRLVMRHRERRGAGSVRHQ